VTHLCPSPECAASHAPRDVPVVPAPAGWWDPIAKYDWFRLQGGPSVEDIFLHPHEVPMPAKTDPFQALNPSFKALTDVKTGVKTETADCPNCHKKLTSYDAVKRTWWCGAELKEVPDWRPVPKEPETADLEYLRDQFDMALKRPADGTSSIYEVGKPVYVGKIPVRTDLMVSVDPLAKVKAERDRFHKLIMETPCTEGVPLVVIARITPEILSDMFALVERNYYRVEAVGMSHQDFADLRSVPFCMDLATRCDLTQLGYRGDMWGAKILVHSDYKNVRVVSAGGADRDAPDTMPRAAHAEIIRG